tara:strand:+ start:664 stop:936 length:273 start_codon:yes stop_codon:yes gene_type:complete
MREINRDEGRVYSINDLYYLEKCYTELSVLIKDEQNIKKRAGYNNFEILSSSWSIEDNLMYDIESIFDRDGEVKSSPINFLLKLELKYTK